MVGQVNPLHWGAMANFVGNFTNPKQAQPIAVPGTIRPAADPYATEGTASVPMTQQPSNLQAAPVTQSPIAAQSAAPKQFSADSAQTDSIDQPTPKSAVPFHGTVAQPVQTEVQPVSASSTPSKRRRTSPSSWR